MCARESRLVFFSVYQLSKAKLNKISIAFDNQVKTKKEIDIKGKGKTKKNCTNLNDIS